MKNSPFCHHFHYLLIVLALCVGFASPAGREEACDISSPHWLNPGKPLMTLSAPHCQQHWADSSDGWREGGRRPTIPQNAAKEDSIEHVQCQTLSEIAAPFLYSSCNKESVTVQRTWNWMVLGCRNRTAGLLTCIQRRWDLMSFILQVQIHSCLTKGSMKNPERYQLDCVLCDLEGKRKGTEHFGGQRWALV